MHVLYGSDNGITASGSQLWTQNSSGIADTADSCDGFGQVLAAANFGNSAQADLAIGIPLENVGSVTNAGAVNIIYGTSTGLASVGNQFWHQNSSGIANSATEGDQFGNALAAANFGKTAQADLAIAAPGETIGSGGDDRGAVRHPLYGTSTGLFADPIASSKSRSLWHFQASEVLDQFGFALSAGNFGRTGEADLAVGVPGESIGGFGAAGAVNVIYGTASGLASTGNQFWHQNSAGILDSGRGKRQFRFVAGSLNGLLFEASRKPRSAISPRLRSSSRRLATGRWARTIHCCPWRDFDTPSWSN